MRYYVHFNGDIVDNVGGSATEGGSHDLGFGIHPDYDSAAQYALDVHHDAANLDGMTAEDVASVGGVLIYAMGEDVPSNSDVLAATVKVINGTAKVIGVASELSGPLGEWLGKRVRVVRNVERFPHFIVHAGAIGTVSYVDKDSFCVLMDDTIPGCEQWDNEVVWMDHEFDQIPEDLAVIPTAA